MKYQLNTSNITNEYNEDIKIINLLSSDEVSQTVREYAIGRFIVRSENRLANLANLDSSSSKSLAEINLQIKLELIQYTVSN